jgi:Flp pilus assembly protein TadD
VGKLLPFRPRRSDDQPAEHQATESDLTAALAHLHQARLHILKGELTAAKLHLHRARAANPHDPEAKAILDSLYATA